ncbi:hypothetical protein TNCV_1585331 [Trichonephila clavipes]|nr:hypothetical protein TNCV_1585331 [Trichonephila clavipes]
MTQQYGTEPPTPLSIASPRDNFEADGTIKDIDERQPGRPRTSTSEASSVEIAFAAGGTLNSRRAASPFVRLVAGDERWEALPLPQGVLPQNWGGTEQNRTVTNTVLKAMANYRCTPSPLS